MESNNVMSWDGMPMNSHIYRTFGFSSTATVFFKLVPFWIAPSNDAFPIGRGVLVGPAIGEGGGHEDRDIKLV